MSSEVRRFIVEARQAFAQGRRDSGKRSLEAALEIDPKDPLVRNMLGMEALAADDPSTAEDHFQAAVSSDPGAAPLWINLAKARRLLGNDEGEREALESALATDQRHLMALIRLAELHERRGETGQATDRWTAVVALTREMDNPPPDLRAIIDHARSYVKDKNERIAQAVADRLSGDLATSSERDRRRITAAMDYMLGRRRFYSNHCHGLHYPFLPADEFFDREHFPWLSELEAATAEIRAELETILAMPEARIEPYVDMAPGTPQNKWTPLDKSLDWGSLHLWRDGRKFEEACELAPRTAAILEGMPLCQIPGRAPTVFFSILKAGAHIPPHTGVTNTRTIVHLPLIVPGQCEFRVGGETREWREGEAFAFDDTIEHEAWNRSDEDRAVLILDVWNPHLSEHEREMICGLFAVADEHRDL